MPVRIYDCLEHEVAWSGALPAIADIYHTPRWAALQEQGDQARGLMFEYSDWNERWLYPFIRRPVPDFLANGLHDIESPYGYAGPLSSSDDPEFLAAARSALDQWCSENRILAEFTTFHPLLSNEKWMAGDMRIFKDRDTVSMEFKSHCEPDFAFAANARGSLKKGQSEGLVANVLNTEEYFHKFTAFYLDAMKAMGASDFYLFDPRYFERLEKLVRESGWLVVSELDGQWAAAAVFLNYGSFSNYHLSAQSLSIKVPGATNIIFKTAARKGMETELAGLHMGGGRTNAADDSLFKFKRSMSTRTHPFMIGRKVHRQNDYDAVKALWRSTYPESTAEKLLFYR
jgi:hypothetical protein